MINLNKIQNLAQNNILRKICEHKFIEVNKGVYDLNSLDNPENSISRSLIQNIQKNIQLGRNSIISEIKYGSPSLAQEDTNNLSVTDIALEYENSGAAGISILTDEKFFFGSNKNLQKVRKVVNLPILQKDFIVSDSQIHFAKHSGANVILLIIAILDIQDILNYLKLAHELELEVILEIHNIEECHEIMIEEVLQYNNIMIGINNRNLTNMQIDIYNSVDILSQIEFPKDILIISESGISSKDDVCFLNFHEIYNFLIGTALMKDGKEGIQNQLKNYISRS